MTQTPSGARTRGPSLVRGFVLTTFGACSASGLAQWSVTFLSPPGSVSELSASDTAFQVGRTSQHAARWSGSAGSVVDLHPPQAYTSQAWDVDQGDVVGQGLYYTPSAEDHALLWPGGSTTAIDLHPASAIDGDSSAYAVCNGVQGGYVYFYQVGYKACLWRGTASSYILLAPPGAGTSYVFGMDAQRQVGSVNNNASLWSGTAESWINLHPPGAQSSGALDIDGDEQVGVAHIAGYDHAYLWRGTAQSAVDLHPMVATFSSSTARALAGGVQVGYTSSGYNVPHRAALWRGSRTSWFDLHTVLPPQYVWSWATGITHDASRIRIAGWAGTTYDARVAVIWTGSLCGTADFDNDGDLGTDADIAAFFACLAGNCRPDCWIGGADFNGDGDVGTDADIEAFFRVLAGQPC